MARSASMDHQPPHGDSNKSEPLKKLVLNPADIGAYMFQGAGVIMALDIVFWPLEVATTRMQATKDVPANFSVEWCHTTLYLGVYEQMTAMIESRFPDTNNTNSATRELTVSGTAGFVAEVVSALLYVPTDIVSQRLRVLSETPGTARVSTLGMCKHMYKSDGIRAFYQGFWATMWANAPGSVAFWAGYETTKKVVYNEFKACEDREQQLDRPGFFSKHMLSQKKGLILALSALNSTWLSTLLISPFDMVRVRLQLLDGAIAEDAAQLKRGWWGMFKLIAHQEGWRGFFKGLGPKFWAAFPGCVGYLFAYEVIKENLVESND
ncbi:hypothetical protein DFQ27_000840 [Actinomortierella ambigua]|uniref:Mitochondrial carrier protein n=1 Tax=Actinomortierella ambigua TaxID=1343610 RepID=A0A9P6QBP5_9FUNG|nr:hypothetical protein DFQ27_000840 [Actinomortierella ambigua]